jgi:ATP-dependent Lhr-like helicase
VLGHPRPELRASHVSSIGKDANVDADGSVEALAGAQPDDVLGRFSLATRAWFDEAFAAPTPAQLGAWDAVADGRNALVVAPTGSGKTLAAFLWALDRIARDPVDRAAEPIRRCRVVYVSPMKALAVDVERNLRAPLAGIRRSAERLGLPVPDVTVGVRSGDTPADERRRFARRPPDVLITTPESLYLVLTSQAREALRGVETVIVDEVHAVAGSKRGAHLALSLERLDALLDRPAQRVGLSATVRPVGTVARFLGGRHDVDVVQPPSDKRIELDVVVPVPDLAEIGPPPGAAATDSDAAPRFDLDEPAAHSIWPHVEERVADLVGAHRSTIVFANSRRIAERLTSRLNEIAHERATGVALETGSANRAAIPAQSGTAAGAAPELAMAHHGSVSKERRAEVEEALKSGRLPAVVATSSLELGVDMGAVDLVVQVESPPSVASGLQRVGRAGHHVGAVSRGVVLPKFRGDLLQSAVVAERMRDGLIEELHVPRNTLDVLAQQIVASVAMDDWDAEALLGLVRGAAPFRELPRSAYDSVLDMLSGRYPSDDFAELRPRLVWDRTSDVLSARPGAQRLAVTSGGTIPDRGMFSVNLVGEKGSRVGELDEEMVYESRVGDVISLGSSSWRIDEITADRVLVVPAPGVPGRLPFWKGDTLGRPAELGRAIGAFVRDLVAADAPTARERCATAGLDAWATDNLLAYVTEQRAATGHVPDDRTVVVERFRDELGDWRVVVHSVFGAQVNAPWALAVGARLRERFGVDVQAMHGDDGIVLRLPDTTESSFDDGGTVGDLVTVEPADAEALITSEVGGSALFASRFRECASRALLLPRRHPGRRSPLWQQRRRSAQLLEVAGEFGSFPIVLETVRECLQDVYDVPALVELLQEVESRQVRVVEVTTDQPSPFARSLLFGYVAAFMYEGDTPLAERRAAALTLDTALLSELLGQTELRELLDADAVAQVERELQHLTPERATRDAEDVADLLRVLGPLTTAECEQRGAQAGWLDELAAARRVIAVRIAGDERWAVVEDAARLRDALGVALPVGLPDALLEPVADPLSDLVSRHARTHGPFVPADVAARYGLGVAIVERTAAELLARGRLVRGEIRPGAAGSELCDAEVLRLLRRRSLAVLRREAEPVAQQALAAFLPEWQHVGARLRGADGVLRVVEQLQGVAVPTSAWESWVLPARVDDYQPGLLDTLTTAGEVVWVGRGSLPGNDGWVTLVTADAAAELVPTVTNVDVPASLGATHDALLAALDGGGALFFRDLVARIRDAESTGGAAVDDDDVVRALWDLVWTGRLTNDTLAPLRGLVAGRGAHRPRTAAPRARYGRARPGRVPIAMPSRSGPPSTSGRWWRLPDGPADPTRAALVRAESMLDRYGVLTRGSVAAEQAPGGFAAAYRVLSALEDTGRTRRVYAVDGLGAAQFAAPGAVDRLRATATALDGTARRREPAALVLTATDPANAYGAALRWPSAREEHAGHRPGRKAGALVVLVDGALVLYVERGGRTLLSWDDDPTVVTAAVDALAGAVRGGALGRLTVERADGARVVDTALGAALAAAGFHTTPRGLRLRG